MSNKSKKEIEHIIDNLTSEEKRILMELIQKREQLKKHTDFRIEAKEWLKPLGYTIQSHNGDILT